MDTIDKPNVLSRRQFLGRTTLALGATALAFPYVGRVLGANDRINVACIGVGGKGDSDSSDAARCGGNIVAICDVDKRRMEAKLKQFATRYPDLKPKQYQDYRKLLDEMEKDIDAVTVSTPDHNHGVAAIRAMKMGKHCFCQKPLVQTVHEARQVRQLANEKKLATQMGNQGSVEPGLRRAVEVIHAGVIGNPLELHVWSNRPIWPQGLNRPTGEDPVPEYLDWECWLGPAAYRPYKSEVYHSFNWRGWYDFGTGALGDMACHTVNMPFRALKLGYPDVIECELASRMYPETFPKTSRIRYEFPEREGWPRLKFWWYDGDPRPRAGLKPLRPDPDTVKDILNLRGMPASGALVIGDKGKVFSPDDYGTQFYVLLKGEKGEKGEEEFVSSGSSEACKAVPQTIPRAKNRGTFGHMEEWFTMMKDGTPAYSNFDIAAYLAEVILLGSVALRVGEGYKMEWDGPNMKSPNLPESAKFVSRQNREGWEA